MKKIIWLTFGLLFMSSAQDFGMKLSKAAISIADPRVVYDGTYTQIRYPNGDVDPKKGVCTDVIIRTYRKLGIDLQKEVHQDMKAHFSRYPKTWGLTRPDTNIDHRRVPNLQTYFSRKGKSLPVKTDPLEYMPGEIVTWMIDGRLPHIGIVTHQLSADRKRPLIMHNVGGGQVLEDCLFRYELTGHYRYWPE